MRRARVVLAIAGCVACGAGNRDIEPSPSLSTSPESQQAFRALDREWRAQPSSMRAGLEPQIRSFVSRYPDDPRARQARLYLAWLALERGALGSADRLAKAVRGGPAGSLRDAATVIVAAVLRRRGRPAESLALLEPLHGKIIEPAERMLEASELVRSELDLKRYGPAMLAVVDWLEDTPDTEQHMVQSEVGALLGELSADALEKGLQTLRTLHGSTLTDERSKSVTWVEGALNERLVRAALTDRNVGLAKRLLQKPLPVVGGAPQREALARLAAEGRIAPRVFGRALGFVLRIGETEARDRAAEVVTGMSRALGIAGTGIRDDRVRMLLRESRGMDDVERALTSLAGDGAAVLVAGVTAGGAALAKQFADQARIPVLLLVSPGESVQNSKYAFLLGERDHADRPVLEKALTERGIGRLATVGDFEAPCNEDAPAGQPSFPTAEWRRDHVEALLLLGDPGCSEDAISAAKSAGLEPLVALGLESSHAWSALATAGSPLVTAGVFPWLGSASAPPDLESYHERFTNGPSWYEALGHDAALLTAAALAELPLERTDEASQVSELHRRARNALAVAEANLWTSTAHGFAGGHTLERTLEAKRGFGAKP